ncbi:MAG: 3-methyl-2-oxobutanoate hydroxymethyltransferase [Oscillatoriales cyanobacterium SM2_2_1]|nr:3-methyl-2-oxobutanoate hydroxymethyltransferase [Oscillatoriales cyanobacterium SM2_2_1]
MPTAIAHLSRWKQQNRRIAALTAADFVIAQILDQAGVDLILVGDSLGMVTLGFANTLPVTLEMMVHHAQAVCRGVSRAIVVVDLPFLSYQASPEQALLAAGRMLKETTAQAVKLEGGYPEVVETIRRLVQVGIPVVGHLGLTPQSVHRLGYRQQGEDPVAAEQIRQQSQSLAAAGVSAIVLEHIPEHLAAELTRQLVIPTIGIGAGADCDGQILVTHDLIGLSAQQPPFAPKRLDLRGAIAQVVAEYCQEIHTPSE